MNKKLSVLNPQVGKIIKPMCLQSLIFTEGAQNHFLLSQAPRADHAVFVFYETASVKRG